MTTVQPSGSSGRHGSSDREKEREREVGGGWGMDRTRRPDAFSYNESGPTVLTMRDTKESKQRD